MCSHYQALKEQEKYRRYFGVEPPIDTSKLDLWPGYVGGLPMMLPTTSV